VDKSRLNYHKFVDFLSVSCDYPQVIAFLKLVVEEE